MYLFLLCYLSSAVLYLYIGVNHSSKNVKAVLKCLPILLLILWFASQWRSRKHYQECSDTTNAGFENETEGLFYITLLSLVFSLIGDALLVGHHQISFPLGVIAFGFAQILYSLSFAKLSISNASFGTVAVSASVVTLVGLGVLFVAYSRLKNMFSQVKSGAGLIITVVTVYFALISLMLWTAVVFFGVFGTWFSFYGLIGAALFYTSDLLITMSAIFPLRIFRRRILVMMTYYLSQFFISLCFLSVCNV